MIVEVESSDDVVGCHECGKVFEQHEPCLTINAKKSHEETTYCFKCFTLLYGRLTAAMVDFAKEERLGALRTAAE